MNSSKIKRYVGLIESSNVYDVAQVTPVTKANQLSKLLKNEVLLKREDLQPIFSFKIRGAYNKLSKLKQKGIKGPFIAASAGNHAQEPDLPMPAVIPNPPGVEALLRMIEDR